MAGLIGFARGTVAMPEEHYPNLRAEFRAVQLLTFTVISRCCSLGVQIALKSCREYLDAGHQAWHFIESTYQVTDATYIGQLEEQLSHIRMGEEETATDYCNRARRILATTRMAGVHYSTASYLTHIIKGLTSSYNLLKRLSLAPSTRVTLNEDSLTSYILQDEAMQEAERPLELLAYVNYVAPVKQGGRPRQRGQSGGGGSSGWKPTKDANKKKSAKDSGRGGGSRRRDDKEVSCSLVGVVEPTVSLAPEAGEDFQAMAAAVQANLEVVLHDSGCSHHLMGTKAAFIDLRPSGDVKHVRGFNGALQDVQGRGTVALQGEAGKQVLIPDVLYIPGVRANLLSVGQLKENGVKLQEDGDGMLLVTAAGDVLGRASYTGRVLCTDLRPCSAKSTTPTTEVVALRAIVSVTKSTPDRLHARLAHVGMHTIRSSAKHEVATGLDLKSVSGADLLCVSCVGGKLARHTFPDQGSDADDVLAVVHVDLCGPFRVAANDGSLYFLLLKDGKTRYVWVRPVAKKSDALQEGVPREAVHRLRERQRDRPRPDLPLHPAAERHGGAQDEDGGGVSADDAAAHGRVASLVAPRSMAGRLGPQLPRAVDAAARDDAIPAADREEARLDAGTVTTSDVVFYKNMSLEVWKSEHGLASGRTPTIPLTDTSTTTLPLLVEVGELAGQDVEDVPSLFPSPAPRAPPLVADLRGLTPVLASVDEGRSGASPVAPAKSITSGQGDVQQDDVRVKSTSPREDQAEEVQPTVVKSAKGAGTSQQLTKEQAAAKPTKKQSATRQSAEEPTTGEKSAGNPAESGRIQRPPDFYVPPAFTTAYDEVDEDLQYIDAEEDEDFPELDPDMHADPEHRWDISMMTVKEALASWKGKAVKAAMDEEIRSLVGMGTWELVERPPGVNIMKNRRVLTTKYHIDDTVEREKARLVVKGFTRVYGADYDETYASVSSYVTQRIFLNIVAILDLNLMQIDTKNAFLQSKLDRNSQVDTALYFKIGDDKVTCWVLVYVDDLLAASSSAAMLKELLKAAFELREILPVQKYFGLEIVRDKLMRKLWLHQQGYADKLRRRFLDEEQNERTPKTSVSVDACATLTFDDEEAQVRQEEEYRQKVGSLLFAVDRCLAYLANTRDTALEFGGGAESLKLVSYVDADDTGDRQNRMSTGGYVFVFGGAAVSWSSQRIKCATLSSTESEYVAATEAGKEGRRLRFLLADVRQLDAGTLTVLRVDKKSAITVAEGMGLTGNLKHMERRQAWLQHMVKRGKFSLRYIPTAEQPAAFLTKALHYPAFNPCSVAIGQVRLVDVGDGDNDVQQ
ncbi:unnamed protein product [Closterium sp. NIES-54]